MGRAAARDAARGRPVPLELVLARSEVAAVYVSRLSAYPTGLEFDLLAIAAPDEDDEALDPMLFGPHPHTATRAPESGGAAPNSGSPPPQPYVSD